MSRFCITVALGGVISALLVFCANDTIFNGWTAADIYAAIAGLSLWAGDTIHMEHRQVIGMMPTFPRFVVWSSCYTWIPATAIVIFSRHGFFSLPHGTGTAVAMMLPVSLITVGNWFDLSWLRLYEQPR